MQTPACQLTQVYNAIFPSSVFCMPHNRKPVTEPASIKDDPFADREAARYENPIPSREYILKCLPPGIVRRPLVV